MTQHSSAQPQYTRRQAIGLIAGPALCVLLLLLPGPSNMPTQAWHVTAITVLMAVWWVSEAVHPAITALLPLVLFPLLHVLSPQEVSAAYADEVMFLFMGAFLIALAMERWKLHQRLALQILRRVGGSLRLLTLGFMVVTAALSMWISNVATTLIMLPIATAILDHAR
jgi:solute carrier family 13 (sodium-dependent dicarboxylate transporter), member 2/3/5